MTTKTKRIRIHTYIHTTMGDLNGSLIPRQTTFMFTITNGTWTLAHTFPETPDYIVREFVRGYLKLKKSEGKEACVRIEKHIFGGAR